MSWNFCYSGVYSQEKETDSPTVHFSKAGVIEEEHTGNCGWTGTKKGLKHHTEMLNFYPICNRESLKKSKRVIITIVAV